MEITLFVQLAGLSAMAVVATQELLKLKIIPLSFANRYPVPTNILLSIVASIVAVWSSDVTAPVTLQGWIGLVGTIAVVASITYNNLIKNWTELRQLEGEK